MDGLKIHKLLDGDTLAALDTLSKKALDKYHTLVHELWYSAADKHDPMSLLNLHNRVADEMLRRGMEHGSVSIQDPVLAKASKKAVAKKGEQWVTDAIDHLENSKPDGWPLLSEEDRHAAARIIFQEYVSKVNPLAEEDLIDAIEFAMEHEPVYIAPLLSNYSTLLSAKTLTIELSPLIGASPLVKSADEFQLVPPKAKFEVLNKFDDGDDDIDPKAPVYIGGYASPVIVDREQHRIEHEALVASLKVFMADGEENYRNVMIQHSNVQVGTVIDSYTGKEGTYTTRVDDRGLYVVAELRPLEKQSVIGQQVLRSVVKGELRSFSISCLVMPDGVRRSQDSSGDDVIVVTKIQLVEVTVCPQGVNPEAKFMLLKGGKSLS